MPVTCLALSMWWRMRKIMPIFSVREGDYMLLFFQDSPNLHLLSRQLLQDHFSFNTVLIFELWFVSSHYPEMVFKVMRLERTLERPEDTDTEPGTLWHTGTRRDQGSSHWSKRKAKRKWSHGCQKRNVPWQEEWLTRLSWDKDTQWSPLLMPQRLSQERSVEWAYYTPLLPAFQPKQYLFSSPQKFTSVSHSAG
jgi:hypothetical protein